ncbi:MAG: hypothetical protein M3004_04985 [Bacteroidota bacterium]|nr:hypothetical protein [Bacteroidota bacterium]
MKQINSRTEKINFLQRLKQGKASINELLPYKTELWTQYIDEPDIYINEKTGKEITAAEMEVKEKNKGDNVIFITILLRSRHEP